MDNSRNQSSHHNKKIKISQPPLMDSNLSLKSQHSASRKESESLLTKTMYSPTIKNPRKYSDYPQGSFAKNLKKSKFDLEKFHNSLKIKQPKFKKNDKNLIPEQSKIYKSCLKTCQNSEFNDYMEDFGLIVNKMNFDSSKLLYCICDGHGGDKTAKYSVERLPALVDNFLKEYPNDLQNVLVNAIALLDKEIEGLDCPNVGNTLTAVLIANNEIFLANVGDSSAILISEKSAKMISYDHKCTNLEEIKRIEECGGYVDDERIIGILAVSRSIGDYEIKNEKKGLIAEPFLMNKKIDKGDKYLVIASDGVWDVLTPRGVREITKKFNNVEDIANEIIEQSKPSEDNISVIVVDLSHDKNGAGI